MPQLKSILVVLDRSRRDPHVIEKALTLARRFGARIELFLCDAEREYQLRHSYDASGAEKERQACLADAGRYLESLRATIHDNSVELRSDAVCESPLYEAVVNKATKSNPDLVMKSPAGEHPGRRVTLSDNDWQLARTCPVPLMLVGPRAWGTPCRFVAAVDTSANETPGLARAILNMSEHFVTGCKGDLDVISCRRTGAAEAERDEHARRVHELAAEIRVAKERVHVLDGDPEHVLPAFAASRRYDVLMLGALTHRPSITPLVGTLTSRLVDALDCDFILVKRRDGGGNFK
jgi:universal stress protein E